MFLLVFAAFPFLKVMLTWVWLAVVPGAMLLPSRWPSCAEEGACGEGGHSRQDLSQRGVHPFKGVRASMYV